MPRDNFGWPPEMQAAYDKWLAENENSCLCLNCLAMRLKAARRAAEKKKA